MQIVKLIATRNQQMLNHIFFRKCVQSKMLSKSFSTTLYHNSEQRKQSYGAPEEVAQSHKKFASYFDTIRNLSAKENIFDLRSYSFADISSLGMLIFFGSLMLFFVYLEFSGSFGGDYDINRLPEKKPEASAK